MKLLVDTDAFCKLGVATLLCDAISVFGAGLSECGRLPALPYMLRRGSLTRRYGTSTCNSLNALVDTTTVCPLPSAALLDQLVSNDGLDPGEAQLMACAAEFGVPVISGDKRAVRALKNTPSLHAALAERVVVLEAILLLLCEQLGLDELRRRVAPLVPHDKSVRVCLSAGVSEPTVALRSYYSNLAQEARPLLLWRP